jgi:hypothetical protein
VRRDLAAHSVDRDDHRLRAEAPRQLGHELRPRDGRGVDRHLVRPGAEERIGVVDGPDPAADGERDRHALGDTPCKLDERAPPLDRRGDVEEDELVGAGLGVRGSQLQRVADGPQPLEPHALHDGAARHVEARDQARERHRSR